MRTFRFLSAAVLCLFFSLSLSAQKRPLDHDAYDGWESVSSFVLSDDGKVICYRIAPQEGDARLVVRRLDTGAEAVVERATGVKMPRDAKFLICKIAPRFEDTRNAKIEKKKPDEMPRDTLAYVNLATLEVVRLSDVKDFKVGYEASPYIFASFSNKKDGGKDASQTDLLVIHTDGSFADTLRNIESFSCSSSGEKLAVVTAKDKKDSLSQKTVKLYDFKASRTSELSSGKKEYTTPVFAPSGNELVFMASDDDEKLTGTPRYSIYLTDSSTKTTEIVSQDSAFLPEGWLVGKDSHPRFSNGAERIVLSLYKHFPAKDTTVVDFEAASLDIWNWDSEVLPPMNKARLHRETLSGVIDLSHPNGFLALSSSPHDRLDFPDGADALFAVSVDESRYLAENRWSDVQKADYSFVNLGDGSRHLLAEGLEGMVSLSPYGKYLLQFNPEDGNWYSINVSEGGSPLNLTGSIGCAFYDEDDDHPSGLTPESRPLWMGKDEYVLLSDKYDVWKLSPDGSKKPVNLTGGEGRKNKITYRPTFMGAETNPYLYFNDRNYPLKGKIYLSAFSEEDSRNGFAVTDAAKGSAPEGFVDGYFFSGAAKALKNPGTIAFLKGNFKEPMDLYLTTDDWKTQTKLTSINPQQKDYLWGDVRMVHWNAYDGTPLKGLLYTPENLSSEGKYPMMIYFYEKNSENLYRYYSPAPSRSIINIPFYVSRGYVVFVPDIVYKDGHPGESAYNCICAGAEAMCEQFPFIDKSRMAIQGQSWGGYQTAYLVTRTDMFAAAGAGAPVGNMTSAYGGIRWESGSSRIPQYEYGQSRIGKTLWEDGGLDLYIENSPVFFAPNVKTPVLIMHNDADGAVPWYQGIEFFMSLRRLGKPAWLLEYNNEAHNLLERRNCKDLSVRLQQFFDYYLKDAPEPVWMKTGIPYERKGNYFGYEAAE